MSNRIVLNPNMLPVVIPNERSSREFAINALTGALKIAAEALPQDIACMSVTDLEEIRMPTEVDFYLRRNLWKQVDLVHKGVIEDITASSIYSGICSKQNYEQLTRNPNRVAWLLTYPAETPERLEFGLSLGLSNLLKFVAKEPTSETAGAFMKAMDMLMNRVHGPIIQKIQAQHAHLNLNKPLAEHHADPNKRIEELKLKLTSRDKEIDQLNDTTIDVTPE